MNGEPGPAKLSCLFTVLLGLVVGTCAFLVTTFGPESAEEKAREDAWWESHKPERGDLVALLRKDRKTFEKRFEDLKKEGGSHEEIHAMQDAVEYDKQVRAHGASRWAEGTGAAILLGVVALLPVWVLVYLALKARMS